MANNLTLFGRLLIVPPSAVIDSARPKVSCDINEQLSVYPSLDTAYILLASGRTLAPIASRA